MSNKLMQRITVSTKSKVYADPEVQKCIALQRFEQVRTMFKVMIDHNMKSLRKLKYDPNSVTRANG